MRRKTRVCCIAKTAGRLGLNRWNRRRQELASPPYSTQSIKRIPITKHCEIGVISYDVIFFSRGSIWYIDLCVLLLVMEPRWWWWWWWWLSTCKAHYAGRLYCACLNRMNKRMNERSWMNMYNVVDSQSEGCVYLISETAVYTCTWLWRC